MQNKIDHVQYSKELSIDSLKKREKALHWPNSALLALSA